MNHLILLVCLIELTYCGLVHHSEHGATSYQHIHMDHFHPVPTYIKHEDKHQDLKLIKESSLNLEVDHSHHHKSEDSNQQEVGHQQELGHLLLDYQDLGHHFEGGEMGHYQLALPAAEGYSNIQEEGHYQQSHENN